MKAVTAKIELSKGDQRYGKNRALPLDSQKDVKIKSKSAVVDSLFLLIRSFPLLFLFFFLFLSFPFPFLHLPPAFGLFLSQTTAISLCTFSKIQLGNVFALTVNHTLMCRHLQIYYFNLFLEPFLFFLSKVNWSGGEYTFTNSLRCTTIKAKFLSK